MTIDLDTLNAATQDAFAAAIGDVCENAPWIAAAAALDRPHATVTALHQSLMDAVHRAPPDARLAFLRGHPELASKVARAGEMTADSIAEQGSLALDRLSGAEFERFETLNAAYRARFGFPFIICVRRHTRDSILAEFARRLTNDPAAEAAAALEEVSFIVRLRLVAKVTGPGVPVTAGMLSTHVLDTVHGRPAAGMALSLHEIGASGTADILSTVTDAHGRTAAPLIAGVPLRIGTYELRFDVGSYFAGLGAGERGFLGIVPIRFSIAEPEAHYHVPLLVSPWSYTTYRGG